MSLYGTRDAAMNWQEDVAREMIKWGFTRGRYSPCLYWHGRLKLNTKVHGDDFVTVGTRQSAKRFRKMREGRFEIKTQVIGPPNTPSRTIPEDVSKGLEVPIVEEGRVLIKVIRRT